MRSSNLGLLLGKKLLPQKQFKRKREPRFECLWTQYGDIQAKTFYTRKQALAFYEAHKEDAEYKNWWITHRDADWEVLENIIG